MALPLEFPCIANLPFRFMAFGRLLNAVNVNGRWIKKVLGFKKEYHIIIAMLEETLISIYGRSELYIHQM